ncbi:MAG TPA: YgjV family protein, partial [Pseudidiomarina sp.]|nr:YgjV family protein [Pseudidiomarina sp.]
MTFTLAEYVGMLALVLNFIAYRQPTADRYRIISAFALGSLSVHFALIDATAGAVVTGLAFFRNFIALRWQGPFVLWFFVIANIVLWIVEAI